MKTSLLNIEHKPAQRSYFYDIRNDNKDGLASVQLISEYLLVIKSNFSYNPSNLIYTTNSLPYTTNSLPYTTNSLPYTTNSRPYTTSNYIFNFQVVDANSSIFQYNKTIA